MKSTALSTSPTPRRQHEQTKKKLSGGANRHSGAQHFRDGRKAEICRLLEVANKYLVYAGEQMELVCGRNSLEMTGLESVQAELRKLKGLVKQ